MRMRAATRGIEALPISLYKQMFDCAPHNIVFAPQDVKNLAYNK
jgi:hypothetical protein